MNQACLESYLGVLECSNSMLVDYDLGITKGYHVLGNPLSLSSNSSVSSYIEAMQSSMKSLKEFQSVEFHYSHQFKKGINFEAPKGTGIAKYLAQDRLDLYKNYPYRTIKTALFFTNPFDLKQKKRGALTTKPTISKKLDKHVDDSLSFADSFISRLKSADIELTEMTSQELFEVGFSYLNSDLPVPKMRSLITDTFCQYSLKDQWLISNTFEANKDHLVVENQFITTMSLTRLPRSIEGFHDWLEVCLNYFDFDFELYVSFYVPDQKEIVSKISHLQGFQDIVLEKLGQNMSALDAEMSQYSSASRKELLSDIASGEESLFEVRINFVLKRESKEELFKDARKLMNTINSLDDALLSLNNYDHLAHYFSFLPGHSFLNDQTHLVHSESVPFLIPTIQPFQGANQSQFLVPTTEKMLIPFSFIEKESGLSACHAIFLGITGGGKSFLMNWLLMNILLDSDEKPYVVIIDMGGSYRKLCQAFGGQYIDIKCSSENGIPIFPHKSKILKKDGQIDPDGLMMIKELLKPLLDDTKESFEHYEDHLIHSLIIGLYKEVDDPVLRDFQRFLHSQIEYRDEKYQSLLQLWFDNLQLFCHPDEPQSIWFNTKNIINLDNPFIVFDVTLLEKYPKVAPVYICMISNLIRLRMLEGENTTKKQYIVRDEVWKLLKDPKLAGAIEEEYRTARKYGTTLFSISQQIDDFFGSVSVDAVRKNSTIKFIFNMKKESFHYLEQCGLNEQELGRTLSLQSVPDRFSEILVKYGDMGSFVLNLQPTEFQKELLSKDHQSAQKEKDFLQKIKDLEVNHV